MIVRLYDSLSVVHLVRQPLPPARPPPPIDPSSGGADGAFQISRPRLPAGLSVIIECYCDALGQVNPGRRHVTERFLCYPELTYCKGINLL